MQKWEYLFVGADWVKDVWRAHYLNGREIVNWKNGPSLYEIANQLGEEGWELVTTPYTGGDTYRLTLAGRLFFKRPKI